MNLTVGVTGHRILAELDKIVAGVDRALDAIERRATGRPLVILTALAEGADRLVAERVLARPSAAMRVVLPLPRDDYAADFASDASRREFASLAARAEEVVELPARESREAAYEAVGEWVVDHSEVMIAVWDGAPEQGRGGTAAIVERARARSMPLAWVRAGNRRPGTRIPTTLGAEQGRLALERL